MSYLMLVQSFPFGVACAVSPPRLRGFWGCTVWSYAREAGLVTALALFFCLSGTLPAYAGETRQAREPKGARTAPADPIQVTVQVRTIRASNPHSVASEHSDAGESEDKTHAEGIEVDSRLDDLRSKLGALGFRTFRFISDDVVTVPLRRKQSLSLSEKTVLTVRPLYLEDQKVGMWLKWVDHTGSHVLLDTRMHFAAGETMLAGTDSSGNCGLILAIRAQSTD